MNKESEVLKWLVKSSRGLQAGPQAKRPVEQSKMRIGGRTAMRVNLAIGVPEELGPLVPPAAARNLHVYRAAARERAMRRHFAALRRLAVIHALSDYRDVEASRQARTGGAH